MDVTNNNVNGPPPSSIVSNNSGSGAPSSSTSPSSGFFLKIRYNQATTSGSKRRVRTEDNSSNSNVGHVDEEEVGDGNDDGTVALSTQHQQPSSTLPPKRIDLDIEGKTYRFRRLTEEEWLTRRVGGGTPAIAPPPTTQTLTVNQAPIPHSTQPETSQQSSLEHSKDDKKDEVAADHINNFNGPPPKTTAVTAQKVASGASQKATGGGSDAGATMMGGVKAIPGLQQGETVTEGIKRRNVESRIKKGRKARQALRVEAIQTYRLLAGGSSTDGATTSTTTGTVDGGKRERGEENLTASSTATLVGRGVVVTATFTHPEEGGLPNKKNGSTTDIAQQQHSKRRPTPAVQGRAPSSSSPAPPQTSSVFTAPTTTTTTTVKPNPLRDQMEADLNDYYITVLAADRRSKASGRGALTDAQLDKMLMEMAIKKKAEVTTNLVKEQMEYVNSVKSSVYPAPTAPPSHPPKEATGTSAEANAELAEEYGFGVGGRDAGEYYYALLEGDETDEGVGDDDHEIDQALFDSESDDDEVADVLGGRFRGKCVGNRHLYQLFLDDVAATTTNSTNATHPSAKGGGEAEAPDADGNTILEEEEDADFKFNDLSVGPHRDHMADQWSTQPSDVAQWNSNYDRHYEGRDTRVADERVPTTSSSSTAAAALSSIKGYLESAMSKHREAGGEGRRPFDDDELHASGDFDDENDATNGATQFVFDDELAYSGATVGVANRIVRGNVGGEDPEVLFAEDDEYDSNAEEHYQGEYPDESPPSGSENDDDDDDDLVASTDDWEFDGDGGAAPGGGAVRRQQQKHIRFCRGDEDDDDTDDDDVKQGGFYNDPTSTLGADDGMNGLDGFEGDDEEDVPQRRFAAPGAEEENSEDGEYSAKGVLRKKVVYFEHAEDDDDEY